MFPLAGTQFPRSSAELSAGIRDALAEVFTFRDPKSVVTVEGQWPALDRVAVNLSEAVVRVSQPPPRPRPTEARQPGITIARLEVVGRPIRYRQSSMDLDIGANSVRADFAHDVSGRSMLLLTDAADGHVEIKISRTDLQAAMLAAATDAAKPHGVAIQDLQLNLNSQGPRSLAGDVRVKAKKMIMSGVVHLRGRVDINDDLVATISGLSCGGEGVVGGMAAALVNPRLKSFDGQKIPLMSFALGDVTLRDLKITADSTIQVHAKFGRG